MADWEHTGKRPRYAPEPRNPKPCKAIDPTHNAQGEWVCHDCGELVRLVRHPSDAVTPKLSQPDGTIQTSKGRTEDDTEGEPR